MNLGRIIGGARLSIEPHASPRLSNHAEIKSLLDKGLFFGESILSRTFISGSLMSPVNSITILST